MFEDMGVFKIYSAMARHAAEAQTHASKNIAHSDDPGYRATSLESFEDYLKRTSLSPSESEAFKITDSGTPPLMATRSASSTNFTNRPKQWTSISWRSRFIPSRSTFCVRHLADDKGAG